MRRAALLLAVLAAVLGFAVAGCGGEEEATPTPETVVGTVPQPEPTETTETTGTETTGTETSGTETTGTETTPAAVEGDPVAGKAVFTGSSGCINCHTLGDAGATGTVGPNLDQAKPSADLVVDRVTNGSPAGMPSFKGSLTDQQIADVAAYISSVAGS